MAKIKFSALVSEMRNKLNGSVMSKNRYGNYVRNKVTPVNPQTAFQQAARNLLGSFSSQWTELTEAQRNGWTALAKSLPFTDIFGDQKFLDGKTLYTKLNVNLVNAGESGIQAPPAAVAIPSFQATDLDAEETAGAMTGLDVTFSETAVPAGFAIAVYATPAIKPGVNFVKNQFRFIGVLTEITAGTGDILSMWNDRFGAAPEGFFVNVRCALISLDSGQAGIPSQVKSIIEASA